MRRRAREKVPGFLNAPNSRGDHLRPRDDGSDHLVAKTFGAPTSGGATGALTRWSTIEHRALAAVCEEKGAHLRVLPITDEGELRMDMLDGY